MATHELLTLNFMNCEKALCIYSEQIFVEGGVGVHQINRAMKLLAIEKIYLNFRAGPAKSYSRKANGLSV